MAPYAILSDSRTPKIQELKTDHRLSVVFYDPKKPVQVRLKAKATVSTSGSKVQKALAELPERSSFDYHSKLPPGSETQSDTGARSPARPYQPNFPLVVRMFPTWLVVVFTRAPPMVPLVI